MADEITDEMFEKTYRRTVDFIAGRFGDKETYRVFGRFLLAECSCPYPEPRPEDVHRGCPIHGDVTVSRDGLRLLYECAKSYDRRIPEANGGAWADEFRALFEDDATRGGQS